MTFSCGMSSFPINTILANTLLADTLSMSQQRTLGSPISFSGVGVFTGAPATIRLCPAEIDHGIVFKRVDLPLQPSIPAKLEYLKPSLRCSLLANQEASVQMVEHLLAALYAFEIDNVLIEISGPEVPIFDGSAALYAKAFSEAQEKGDIHISDAYKPVYSLRNPIAWSKKDVHLVALPSHEYRISYTLDYPHSPLIGSQYYSTLVDPITFKNEIASARTFCLYEELAPLIEKGFLKGVSLDNGLVINERGAMNPEGMRFLNEPARHKTLDLIGDLSLTGIKFNAHIIAIKSGHASNHIFGLELLNHIKREISQ